MRRFVVPLAGLGCMAALAACSDGSIGRCFEPGAIAYPVYAPQDTTVIFRWPDNYLPVRVYAESVGTLRANTTNAMQQWVNAFRCNELSLQLWPDSNTADVVVRNPPSLPAPLPAARAMGAAPNACLGRTDFYLDSTGLLVRPIRSYVAPNNIDSATVEACYQYTITHELGHALGLFSHSPNSSDLMYANPSVTAPSVNDKYTIQILYHLDAPVKPQPR